MTRSNRRGGLVTEFGDQAGSIERGGSVGNKGILKQEICFRCAVTLPCTARVARSRIEMVNLFLTKPKALP